MMKKTLMAMVCVAVSAIAAKAQETTVITEPTVKVKKLEHHVGVQVNELVRQVVNLNGNNNSANNNPYLLTYNINSIKTGWGLRLGVGCSFKSFATDDGITKNESDLNDKSLRLGVEKAFKLSERWSTGVGVDLLYSSNNDFTSVVTRSISDTVTTKTNSVVGNFGGGVMGWLRFNITSRIQVGTEASFYYTAGNNKQEISVTQRAQTGPFPTTKVTTTSKIDNNTTNGVINLPVALFLSVRF